MNSFEELTSSIEEIRFIETNITHLKKYSQKLMFINIICLISIVVLFLLACIELRFSIGQDCQIGNITGKQFICIQNRKTGCFKCNCTPYKTLKECANALTNSFYKGVLACIGIFSVLIGVVWGMKLMYHNERLLIKKEKELDQARREKYSEDRITELVYLYERKENKNWFHFQRHTDWCNE